jgi:DNA-binding NtrC family response regulator
MTCTEVTAEPLTLREVHVVIAVDDEPAVLASLKRLLRREPYTLLTTQDPGQVLAWVSNQDVSLVICDQRMPKMLGTELLEAVAERSPTTARVLFTGFPGSTVLLRGMKEGLQLLLYKPWNNEALRRMIRFILHEREMRRMTRGDRLNQGEPQ